MQLYNKWNGLRLDIVKYCKENNISKYDFRFLGIYEWQNVYYNVLKHFVKESYSIKNGLYWSNIENGFKEYINKIYVFQEGIKNNAGYEWLERLSEIVKCEKVYILIEEDNQNTKYWVAECKPSVVHLIINEAIEPTDYYITDKKFNWLITENHHDIVQFIGEGLDADIIKAVCLKQ